MGKHKKKHSKKDDISDDILDAAALSIRKYRKMTNELAKLSTTQKLVGGAMLLAAGYFYLDKVKGDWRDELPGLRALLAGSGSAADDEAQDAAPAPRLASASKNRKSPKPGKVRRPPAAAPDDDDR